MADVEPARRARKSAPIPLPDDVALVLQGGGALGAFQAGVYEALDAAQIPIDRIAGISIGAVNAAIIAGNPPERRVERLREFWSLVSSSLPSFPIPDFDPWREAVHEWSAGYVALFGVPGFFSPRRVPPTLAAAGSIAALSFYDSSQLQETLDRLVDWDRVNGGGIGVAVGAVDVESGNFRYFDTKREPIDARHVMASGALPPGLPPVEIDGRLYWDGGLVSNTPLSHVLDTQEAAMLVFQVDLFSATAERPRTIMDVAAREKEIRYSSRTRQVSAEVMRRRRERELVCRVLDKLPDAMRDDADVAALRAAATEKPLSLVQLINRANSWEGGARDYEFSRASVDRHWQAGRAAVAETIMKSQVMAEDILNSRTSMFDLTLR